VQEILITMYLIFQSRSRYYRTATNQASLRPICYSRNKKLVPRSILNWKIRDYARSTINYATFPRAAPRFNLERQPMGIAVTWPGKISPCWKL